MRTRSTVLLDLEQQARSSAPDQRVITAWHEASHAVFALAEGLELRSVDIVRTEERVGFCDFKGVDFQGRGLLSTLAAPLLEEQYFSWYSNDSHDLRLAREQALLMVGELQDEADLVLERAEEATRELLSRWSFLRAIDTTARALLEQERLEGPELERLCRVRRGPALNHLLFAWNTLEA